MNKLRKALFKGFEGLERLYLLVVKFIYEFVVGCEMNKTLRTSLVALVLAGSTLAGCTTKKADSLYVSFAKFIEANGEKQEKQSESHKYYSYILNKNTKELALTANYLDFSPFGIDHSNDTIIVGISNKKGQVHDVVLTDYRLDGLQKNNGMDGAKKDGDSISLNKDTQELYHNIIKMMTNQK